ncbi:hypothetical protein GX563_04355 [Candidatus Bathyarchaeota archaeon]|nr:hypothetical protein [Candidatus Bathyarchaeota archaeon]
MPISQQDMAQPWIFKGAYATYTGQVVDVSTQTNLSARIEVTDVNASHVQVRTSSTIAPSSGPAVNDHFTLWISKANVSFQPPGEAFARSYSAQISNRSCTVYEYTNEAINATYYIDDALQWPVRLVYMTGFENQLYTLDFRLNSTNIGALDEAFFG